MYLCVHWVCVSIDLQRIIYLSLPYSVLWIVPHSGSTKIVFKEENCESYFGKASKVWKSTIIYVCCRESAHTSPKIQMDSRIN